MRCGHRVEWRHPTAGHPHARSSACSPLPSALPQGMTPKQFLETMAVDKKVLDGQLRLVLLKGPLGNCVITSDFPLATLQETLDAFCRP